MTVPHNIANVLSCLENVRESGDGWVARCPHPNHSSGRGDKNPSLRIAIGESGNVLLLCRTGCSTEEVLNSVGLEWKALLPGSDKEYYRSVSKTKVLTNKDAAIRDRAYRMIFDKLELEPEHAEHLKSRGFNEQDLQNFKTIRSESFLLACRALNPKFDPLNYNGPIPGLREAGINTYYSGILIPVFNYEQQLVAFKVRRFAGDPKYIYVSDPEATCSVQPHWPRLYKQKEFLEKLQNNEFEIQITEGEIKAEICSKLSPLYTISVPGVGAWHTGWLQILALIKKYEKKISELTYKRVVLAYDWPDVKSKNGVQTQLFRFINQIERDGFEVSIQTWPELEYKGLDDLFVAGYEPETVNGIEDIKEIVKDEESSLSAVCVSSEESGETERTDLCEFPLEVYPESLASFCQAVTDRTDSPLDFPGVASLVVGASSIGASRRVKIVPGWYEAPCFYAAIIAPPGSGKSPAIGRVQRPVILRQEAAYREWKHKMERLTGARTETKPILEEYYTTDITVAAVTHRLANNPKGILLASDEIMSWVKSFGQVGLGNDQDFYLSIWNGQPVKVDRKTGDCPVTWISYPYISVLGGVQPKRLPELSSGGRGDDGFLDRFLFSFPEIKTMKPWMPKDYHGTGTDDLLLSAWEGAVTRLFDLGLLNEKPQIIHLTQAGWNHACDWFNNSVLRELEDTGFPEYLRGFWLKLKAYYFRFALVLEYIHWAYSTDPEPTVISIDSLRRAEKLVEYFKCHARRVAGSSTPSEEIKQITELNRWAWSGKKEGTVSARDVVRSNNPLLPRKMADARTLLITAKAYGAGEFLAERDGVKDIYIANKSL